MEKEMMRGRGMYRIGVTERYDESLAVMECELAAHFPGLDLSYAAPSNRDGAKAGGSVRQNLDDPGERRAPTCCAGWQKRTATASISAAAETWNRTPGCRG